MDDRSNSLYKTHMDQPRPRLTQFVESLHVLPESLWEGPVVRVPRAGHVICGPDYQVARDWSPGHDLLFCLEGQGRVTFDGQTSQVTAGSFVALAGEGPHSHAADPDDPWSLLWVRVHGGNSAAFLAVLFGPKGSGILTISHGTALVGWFGRVFLAMRDKGPNLDLDLHQLIAELWPLLNAERLSLAGGRLPPALERLTASMAARPDRPWSADDMQAVAKISAAQLRRQFSQHLQTTPREWLRRERILLAQDLLLKPGARVAEVAEACGFSDIYHFSREFRRTVGQPPTLWRKSEGVVDQTAPRRATRSLRAG